MLTSFSLMQRSAKLCMAIILWMACGRASAAIVTFKEKATVSGTGLTTIMSYPGTADSYIPNRSSGNSYGNFGAQPYISVGSLGFVGTSGSRNETHGLIRFDISALQGKYSAINSVTLRLYPYDVARTGPNPSSPLGSAPLVTADFGGVAVLRLTQDNSLWSEGKNTGSSGTHQFSPTSWRYIYQSGTPFSGPPTNTASWAGGASIGTATTPGGASISGTDYRPVPLAVVGNPGGAAQWGPLVGQTNFVDFVLNGNGTTLGNAALKSMIDSWVTDSPFSASTAAGDLWWNDSGTGTTGNLTTYNAEAKTPNEGFLLYPVDNGGLADPVAANGGDNPINFFYSAQATGGIPNGLEPELIIDYTPLAAAIPEPGSLALFLVGSLGLLVAGFCKRRGAGPRP